MKKRNPDRLVRRSTLMMPADRIKFIENAWKRNADAVTLDLEDGVARERKEAARNEIRSMISLAGMGGSDVVIRINNEPGMWKEDLDAAVWPGVICIAVPKISFPEEIMQIEEEIGILEERRGIQTGSVQTMLSVENAQGYINRKEVTAASVRGVSLALGTEDFTRDIGVKVERGEELLAPKLETVITACAFGLQPKGLIGSMADYRDLEGLFQNARMSYQYGFRGAGCIHPDQVDVLNRAFLPREEEIAYAREVVRAMEEAEAEGRGTASLNGKMIDRPVAVRAQRVIDRTDAINSFEGYKSECRKRCDLK